MSLWQFCFEFESNYDSDIVLHLFSPKGCKSTSFSEEALLLLILVSIQLHLVKSNRFQSSLRSPSRSFLWKVDNHTEECAELSHNSRCRIFHHNFSWALQVRCNKPKIDYIMPIDPYCSKLLIHFLRVLEVSWSSKVNDFKTREVIWIFE